jgi:hypothetical protein
MHLTSTQQGGLSATLVSDAIRPHLDRGASCAVHSVFRSVVNLEIRDGLITIGGPSVDPLPNGVSVDSLIDFQTSGLRPGQRVILGRARIRIPACGVDIDLSRATDWSPRITPTRAELARARWRARAPQARDIVATAVRGRPESTNGFGDLLVFDSNRPLGPVAGLAAPRLERLAAALRDADQSAASLAAESLVGLGPGLTPSGDDALVGVAAVVTALTITSNRDVAFLRRAAAVAPTRTTAVSSTFLRHAAVGEFSGALHALMAALVGPDASMAQSSIERLVAFGATSGVDTLVGVLLGLDALAAPASRRTRIAA